MNINSEVRGSEPKMGFLKDNVITTIIAVVPGVSLSLTLHLYMTACGQLMKQIKLAAEKVLLKMPMSNRSFPSLIVSIGQQNLEYVANRISSIPTKYPRKGPT